MATPVTVPSAPEGGATDQTGNPAEPIWHIYAVLFASTSVMVGVLWDISWHMSVGRDSLFSEPHLAIYAGGIVAGLACGYLALKTSFAEVAPLRAHSVTFWRYFQAPLGAWVAIWGSIAMITSGPFDDWWHNAYGLDVEILSPPHVVLALGIIAIQVGALLMVLSRQNRESAEGDSTFRWLYALAAGLLLVMVCTLITEYTQPNQLHRALTFKILAGVLPLFIVSVARAGRLKWPATAMASIYLALVMVMGWILQAFPAEALLAPILRPLDAMVAPTPPLMLIPAALAIDLTLRAVRSVRSDWLVAPIVAGAFVAVLIPTLWYWAEFYLSPLSRHYFFFGDQWSYQSTPGPFQYEFWGAAGDPVMAGGSLLVIFALAAASTRVGLWWGTWMRSVQR